MMQQLANNPQMIQQLVQMMQQNGMLPTNNQGNQRPPMNWNMPTNPIAMMWLQNVMNAMNNQSNSQQTAQNPQNQTTPQSDTQTQQTKNKVSSVRVVKSPDEIKPNEIPSDGSISLFVNDDLGIIYGKRWTNNGTVDNMRFVKYDAEEPQVQNNEESPNQSKSNNLGFDVNGLMQNIATLIDDKLEQFKKDYSLDRRNQPKSSNGYNNKKGGEVNG